MKYYHNSLTQYAKKIINAGLLAFVTTVQLAGSAAAHVVVRPAEAVTAGFQTFTVGAPNEKEVPFNQVKLVIPNSLKSVSVTAKSDWKIDIEKQGTGETAVVKSITWSGNQVSPGFREDFTFSAQVPAEETELQWKAYQTYADGLTVAWDMTAEDQPKKEDGSPDFSKSGPFSVTKVVKETEAAAATQNAEQAAADAKTIANRALYIAAAGVLIGLVGVYIATRSK